MDRVIAPPALAGKIDPNPGKAEPLRAGPACPVCAAGASEIFCHLPAMPVNVCVQWPSAEAARACPRGDIMLALCPGCGYIWNVAFDPGRLDYSAAYENSLFFSPLFQDYSRKLALRLIERYGLREKELIDIGCGKGDFLFLLCREGPNRGIGFDTSFAETAAPAGVKIIRDFYSEKYADIQGDLVASRYVLEHVPHPRPFLEMVRRAAEGRRHVIFYFEVPNTGLILRELSIWDIIYEHCSYFSAPSIRKLFAEAGFQVVDLYECYQGQFLGLEAALHWEGKSPANDHADGLAQTIRQTRAFATRMKKQLRNWKSKLEALRQSGLKACVWGAGAKGVTFLNMLQVGAEIPYIVDINPRKEGLFVPGTGQQIVSPEFLRNYQPDCVIISNPIYADEIHQTMRDLDLHPIFLSN